MLIFYDRTKKACMHNIRLKHVRATICSLNKGGTYIDAHINTIHVLCNTYEIKTTISYPEHVKHSSCDLFI